MLFAILMGVGLVVLGPHPQAQAISVFIDQFTVIRNGSTLFDDPFNDMNPSEEVNDNVPNFASGNPASYFVLGTVSEGGGKARLDKEGAAIASPAVPATFGGAQSIFLELAQLQTNIDPLSNLGLKSNATFSVEGVFDLVEPTVNFEAYGIRLFDIPGGNDFLRLVVRRVDTQVLVEFDKIDTSASTFTVLASTAFAPGPGDDQIGLRLTRADTGDTEIDASFAYIDGGVTGTITTFTNIATIFNGENFTRGGFLYVSPVPEPSTLLLLASGLLGLAGWRWRRSSLNKG